MAIARQAVVAMFQADIVEADRRVAMRGGSDLDDARGLRGGQAGLDEVREEEGTEVVGAELLFDLAVLRWMLESWNGIWFITDPVSRNGSLGQAHDGRVVDYDVQRLRVRVDFLRSFADRVWLSEIQSQESELRFGTFGLDQVSCLLQPSEPDERARRERPKCTSADFGRQGW
jgi:hypothetical protein